MGATTGGSGAGSLVELSAGLGGGTQSDTNHYGGQWIGGELGLRLFPQRRVVDDATPLPLQPFLQRITSVGLVVGGGGARHTLPIQSNGWAGTLFADAYVTRWLALTGALGFRFDHRPTATYLSSLSPDAILVQTGGWARRHFVSVGAGFRVADLRIDVAYRSGPLLQDGIWQEPSWGSVAASVNAVVLEHLDIGLAVHSLDGGAAGIFWLDYYPSRRLGLLSGIRGSYMSNDTWDRGAPGLGIRVGLSFWVARWLGLRFLYEPSWATFDRSAVPGGGFAPAGGSAPYGTFVQQFLLAAFSRM